VVLPDDYKKQASASSIQYYRRVIANAPWLAPSSLGWRLCQSTKSKQPFGNIANAKQGGLEAGLSHERRKSHDASSALANCSLFGFRAQERQFHSIGGGG